MLARRAATLRRAVGRPPGPGPVSFVELLIVASRYLRARGRLTPAQTVVCLRLLLGDVDKEIATCLGCRLRTASQHVAAVLAALDVWRGGLWPAVLEWLEVIAGTPGPPSVHVVARD